ncbi:MAG: hypothetical protein O9282_11190 [Flavobacterium sp.]|jgi:hypothetical protein|uniref:hypothetical protein n=1 Tax=Flavobacterium sp. TaxID=239 RepID=UPI0022C88742|nr:hypothetical protein [Flavobacterium sp.]MCZ8331864.1 hypothetical protein [Flavobacterium sp.]
MKKIYLTILLMMGLSLTMNAKTINDKNKQQECVIENKNIVTKEKIKSITKISHVPIGNIFQQLSFCAQVQIDIKESYTEKFGPDRANTMALYAFMGCMGYI